MLFFATMMVLPNAAIVYVTYDRARWISSYPFMVLLWQAERSDATAFKELERRHKAVELSADQTEQLAEVCLRVQGAATKSPILQRCLGHLEQLNNIGLLSEAHKRRFWDQMVHEVILETRGEIRVGEPLLLGVTVDLRTPTGWMANVSKASVEIQSPSGLFSDSLTPFSDEGDPIFARMFKDMPLRVHVQSGRQEIFHATTNIVPGSHVANYAMTLELSRFWRDTTSDPIIFSTDRPLSVFSMDHAEDFQFKANDSLETQLAAALYSKVECYHERTRNGVTLNSVSLSIGTDVPLPISVAFDVFLEGERASVQVGQIYGRKGEKLIVSELRRISREEASTSAAKLVLQTNTELPRNTIGLHEIWDGTIALALVALSWPADDLERSSATQGNRQTTMTPGISSKLMLPGQVTPPPVRRDYFDGVNWDMRFDTKRGKWMPADRIQNEPFRKD